MLHCSPATRAQVLAEQDVTGVMDGDRYEHCCKSCISLHTEFLINEWR